MTNIGVVLLDFMNLFSRTFLRKKPPRFSGDRAYDNGEQMYLSKGHTE